MGRNRLVAACACQHVFDEPDCIGGTQASRIDHLLAEAIVEEPVGEAQRVVNRPLAEASLLDEIGLEVRQQCCARDLRFGQRRRPRHADIDQMLGEPPREIVRLDGLPVLSRHHPAQPFGLVERQCGRRDPFRIHHLAELPDDRPVVLDGGRLVVGDGKTCGERVQVRLDAGLQIDRHVLRTPRCWSDEDYAECAPRHHAANRDFSTPCGIIRVTAL